MRKLGILLLTLMVAFSIVGCELTIPTILSFDDPITPAVTEVSSLPTESATPMPTTAPTEEPETKWIYAVKKVATAGLNEYWQADGLKLGDDPATVTIYTSAPKDENGEFVLEDSNIWAVIVSTNNRAYPLFPRATIELGGVNAAIMTDFDESGHILLTVRQSSLYCVYDWKFDGNKDAFYISHSIELNDIQFLGESN